MSDRPKAALAMNPRLAAEVFPADVIQRLSQVVDLDPAASVLTELNATNLAKVEILLTGWSCPYLDDAILDAAPRLRAVVHAAGTIKHHVGPAVFERGITVSAASEVNARPVADFTVAALILAAKQAFFHARSYAAGRPYMAHLDGEDLGLTGSTVGIIGASRIGRMVMDRLAAYDVQVLVSDPYLDRPSAAVLGAELVELDELFRGSDFVSVHAPQLPETHHMVDGRRLALLRDGGVVINTARGSLVDTDALTKECRAGRISAILDVTDPEPLPPGHPLLPLPNVFLTPHLAGSRGRELRKLGEFAVAEVERLVRGEHLQGIVRQADLARIA